MIVISTLSMIKRILTNPLYTGKVINGKGEIEDFLTSKRKSRDEEDWMVVEREDFRIIAQEVMFERRTAFKTDKQRQSNQHLFSTILRCKECGWSFRRTVRSYKKHLRPLGVLRAERKGRGRVPKRISSPLPRPISDFLEQSVSSAAEGRSAFLHTPVLFPPSLCYFSRPHHILQVADAHTQLWRCPT